MTQMTPAQQRAAAESTITPLGKRRLKLLADLERLEAELRPAVLGARRVEVPIRRITELTGLAPNTIRQWAKGPTE